jgi:hypothetical protein
MEPSIYDFKLVFEKLEESKDENVINSQIEIENFNEINESILELMEMKSEMDDVDKTLIFTTT